ncbi:MAG: PrgI family protein [Ktedonobacterales bacterium]|nr:PrgI family protein [Ktedonobacterales bacterium]
MLRRHEIPTKLEVEDKIVFGLTARQLLFLGIGIALGYVCFQHLGHSGPFAGGRLGWGLLGRLACAAVPISLSMALAFIRPADRPLETWSMALLRYRGLPKACIWRPTPRQAPLPEETTLLSNLADPLTRDEPLTEPEPQFSGLVPTYRDSVHGREYPEAS